MILNVILALIFLGSCTLVRGLISRKIPLLLAIPDEAITETLHNDSRKWHLFVIHFTSFYREKFFQDGVRNFLSKIFYRIHVLVMRLDNGLIAILRKVRAHGDGNESKNSENETQHQISMQEAIKNYKNANPLSDIKKARPISREKRISFAELTTSLREQKSSPLSQEEL